MFLHSFVDEKTVQKSTKLKKVKNDVSQLPSENGGFVRYTRDIVMQSMTCRITQNLFYFLSISISDIWGFVYRYVNAIGKKHKIIFSVMDQHEMMFHLIVNMLFSAKPLYNFFKYGMKLVDSNRVNWV